MKQKIILPISENEINEIRKHPHKKLKKATYRAQKVGIIFYTCMLLFLFTIFIIGMYEGLFILPFYLLPVLIFTYASDVFNLFALTNEGILSGTRFIPWEKMKSFQFIEIDMNHKFYGYSKETNSGYELKIKTAGFPVSCIITSEEMKEQLQRYLNKKNIMQ